MGGKHNFRWPPCKLMSSRGLWGPGLCHSVSRSPIGLYTCSLVFKPPTPVSMYCQHQPCYFGEKTEAFRRGHLWVPPVSPPPNLFPHLAGPLPSTICSLCTEVQPVHLCLIPAVPLAESRTLSSCSHFWGSCYSVRVVSSRYAFQSAPMHFLNPSYIHHSWNVLDQTV